MKRRPELAVIGMATVDYIYDLPSHPKEDSENRANGHCVSVGGPAGRSAIAAARLGGSVRLLATCGTGVHADTLSDQLDQEGVDCNWVVTEGDSQHSAIIVAADKATRTTVWLPQPRAGGRLFDRIDEFIEGADAVLLDCTDEELTRRVVAAADSASVPSVVDTGSWKPWAPDVLDRVNHVIAPSKFFTRGSRDLADIDVMDWLRRSASETVVATEGADGGRYAIREDPGSTARYQAASVAAIDTCGAGDTFHGAYLFATGAGFDVADSLCIAAWSAGLKTVAVGNRSIPRWDELSAHINIEVGW